MSQNTKPVKPARLPAWFLNAEGHKAVDQRVKDLRNTLAARRQVRELVKLWGVQ